MTEVNLLAEALVKAQSDFMKAGKDAKNPFFKSTYATLNSVWSAVSEALLKNGLTVLQPISIHDGISVVKTIVMHISGQSIESECPIVVAKQNDPQALGSAITYARRYSLASMLGVMTDEDDDGNKAAQQPKQAPANKQERQAPASQKETPAPAQTLKERLDACIQFLSAQPDKSLNIADEKSQTIISRTQDILNELQTAGRAAEYKQLNDLCNTKLLKVA